LLSNGYKPLHAISSPEHFLNIPTFSSGSNSLHLLTRTPSALRAYIAWTISTKQTWGSVTNFVLQTRLHWTTSPPETCPPGSLFVPSNSTPLTDPQDYKVLLNDWPYGLASGIRHLIIWIKHRLPADQQKGDLTETGRDLVDNFVKRRFVERLGESNVLWFRNWTGLQSVRAVEHVHVLVRNVDEAAVNEISKE
jgi:hypothetical protein